tara:strand:- start:299 stop:895 length:597 start_codon:yes stop_codon:yes gene_type:complete
MAKEYTNGIKAILETNEEYVRPNKFMSSRMSQWLAKGMFIDTYKQMNNSDVEDCLYTLGRVSHDDDYPSLYQLYMDFDDSTEYLFAEEHLGGWDHWVFLSKQTFFLKELSRWREELELRSKARALGAMKAKANDPNDKDYYTCNKFLLEKGWDAEHKETRALNGYARKTSKQEIVDTAEELYSIKEIEGHAKRVVLDS